ncbi:MAG: hypothetical protein IJR04_09915 [Bacteroidales bacterium]|nr:hypothetical protein [Bacteroidales bacterium]
MKQTFLFLTALLLAMSTKAQDYNFEDYFYPFGFRTFLSIDSGGKTTTMSQFSFTSQYFDNYLIEEVYVGMGMMSAKTTYRYRVEGNTVVSDVQLRQNAITGSTKYQDKIVLFAFPSKDKPYTWSETDSGDKYQCTSEYVYINASIYHKSLFVKAVKMTRDNSYVYKNKKHRVIETSYWVSNYGRIITYVDWDGTKNAIKLDVLDYVQEIPEEEYNSHTNK